MTLVMDGVRRSGLVLPTVTPAPRFKTPVLSPVVPASPTRIGMDGIRRSVPTPRELLASMQAAEVVAPEPAIELIPAMRDWRQLRQAASFSVVATTLTVAGVVTGANVWHTTATTVAPAVKTAAQVIAPAAQAAVAAPAAAPAPLPADTGLQSLVSSLVGSSQMYGVVVKNLSTGETATVNPGQAIESASLYKLFVANTVYNWIDTGRLSINQRTATGQTVGQCLSAMITVSDNTCGHALGNLVGWGAQNASLRADGYTATNLAGAYPQTSAQDVATLYERLYTNSLNSPSSNDSFLSLLKGQRLNAQLPTGLPAGTVFAHKTGYLDGYVHDAGIVYGPKANYLVVVMSGPWGSQTTANQQFGNISQQLWSHFQQ